MIKSDKCFEDARKILADSSSLVDNIMYSMGDGLSIQDRNMRIVYQNQFMIDNFGSHIGERCHVVYEKRDNICDGCPIIESFRTGKVTKALRVGITNDGTPFRFENIASPLMNDKGEVVAGMELCRIVEDREKALDDLRTMMEYLKQLINAIPNPIFFKDKNGLYTGCNDAFENMFGVDEKDIKGKQIYDVLPSNQTDLFANKDKELLRQGGIQVFETQLMFSGKHPRDIINSQAVLTDNVGEIQGLVGTIQDITDLRQTERALRDSEKRFRSLFEGAPVSFWLMDFSEIKKSLDQIRREGNIDLNFYFNNYSEKLNNYADSIKVIDVNAYSLELYGATDRSNLLSKAQNVFARESLPAFRKTLIDFLSGDISLSAAGFIRTLDGKLLPVIINSSLATGAEGTWDRVLVSVLDISDRVEAESALRDSEKRYRSLVEALREGMVQVDEKAKIRFCNKQFIEMTGYSRQELVGASFNSLMNEKNRRQFEKHYAGRKAGYHDSYELTLENKNGHSLDTLISAVPVFDEHGQFRGSYALITDITDRKKLEYQLRQSQKLEAIGQLAAGIAHEINTPVQFVSSNNKFLQDSFSDLVELYDKVEVLLQKLREIPNCSGDIAELAEFTEEVDFDFIKEEVPRAFEANKEGLDRISVIVLSMKEFAHPGKEEKQPEDLNQIIENTVTVAKGEWKYVAGLQTDLDPELPLVNCVSSEIKQVILNIVVNAAQAIAPVVAGDAGQKGLITISSRTEDNNAVITISDTGPGIAPELKEKVFDPFFTTKEVGKGTGQGLAISYRVIRETHGGSLSVANREGGGAVFEIRLPLNGVAD